MDKPRIFLGSSAAQTKLLQSLTRGLEDKVDFAAFVFARDGWTIKSPGASEQPSGACMQVARSCTDLLGLTSIRYGEELTAAEIRGRLRRDCMLTLVCPRDPRRG